MNAVLGVYSSNSKEREQFRVLDCGCGRGVYGQKFSQERYVGLDIDVSSIGVAHLLYPDKSFIVGNATNLPFKDDTFNHVICSEVLEHISNDRDVLTELARVTKPLGVSVMSVPNLECENVFVNWQRNLIDESVGHVRRGYYIAEISNLIDSSGFKVRESKFDCGPVTALIECCLIRLGNIFGSNPSDLNQLVVGKKPLLVQIALGIYELLFPILVSFTYLDRLLPRRCRSNMVIMAERYSN